MSNVNPRHIFASFSDLWTTHGYTIEHATYDAHSFGNAMLELRSDRLRWRLQRDRSQIFVDVSASVGDQEWYDVREVLSALSGDSLEPDRSSDSSEVDIQSPQQLAELVIANLGSIELSFDQHHLPGTRSAVRKLREQRPRPRHGGHDITRLYQ